MVLPDDGGSWCLPWGRVIAVAMEGCRLLRLRPLGLATGSRRGGIEGSRPGRPDQRNRGKSDLIAGPSGSWVRQKQEILRSRTRRLMAFLRRFAAATVAKSQIAISS